MIQLNVNDGPGTELLCRTTTHPLKERLRQAGRLGFLYDSEVLSWSSSDFVFTYNVSSNRTFGGVLLNPPLVHDPDRRDMFYCYLFLGEQQSRKWKHEGQPPEDTKNVLFAALAKLDSSDLFNVIAFNGETYLFSSSMEPTTAEVTENATQWINMNFVAGGGTNILLPLNQVTKQQSVQGRSGGSATLLLKRKCLSMSVQVLKCSVLYMYLKKRVEIIIHATTNYFRTFGTYVFRI